MPRLTAQSLASFAQSLLAACGAPEEEGSVVASSLVASDLCGHASHGVVRIPAYVRRLDTGELVAGATLEVVRETAAAIVCDAHRGFGQVQARRLTDRVLEKARIAGVACGTARNCGHIGRLGEYVERVAEAGMAAMLSVNDNGVFRIVAPPGGTEARVSTNPLAIAVPTDGPPLVYDASTSVVAQGKVLVQRMAGEPCPPGWLQDAAGQATTDPHVIVADPAGTILPLGGSMAHKGFGLAVMLDALCGGLSGGCCPPPKPGVVEFNCVLLVVWDPEWFAGRNHLIEQVAALVDSIRSCPMKPGVNRIRLPGDESRHTRELRRRQGIPLAEGTWRSLLELAARLGVEPPPVDRRSAAGESA